jgi:HEAT repeat protein
MAKRFLNDRVIASLAILVVLGAHSVASAQRTNWGSEKLSSPFPETQSEKELIEQLKTGSEEAKAMACKQLSIYGGKAAVPELAKLLGNEHLTSWARTALEVIPDPSADAALIEAAGKLQGRPLVGVINSIGVKRSAGGIDQLAKRLGDDNEEVACAAAVAIGKIGGEPAIHALHTAFAGAKPAVRSAICEGGILCAERCLADGDREHAVQIYDFIRGADVPQQRKLEGMRGAIIARGDAGIPLLVEQLKSPNKAYFQLALGTARELKGDKVVEALASQLASATPDRASLIVIAMGDRGDAKLPAAVVEAARTGNKLVRLAALQVIGKLGDASSVAALLESATDADAELAQAAKDALAALPDANVNPELSRRLATTSGKALPVLIQAIGQRRADAAAELVKLLDSSDKDVRKVALGALGGTAGPEQLHVLVTNLCKSEGEDAEFAETALITASIRMPDREATAGELAAAMPSASTANKARLVRILGAMGGPKALEAIAAAVKSGDGELQDAGTRVLGQWMTIDAAPVLMEITKSSAPNKYRVRALRGYLRLARQLKIDDAERLAMCRQALAVAERDDERALALDALKRCPSAESIELASSLLSDEELRDRAVETAIFIGEKIKAQNPAAAKTAGEKALKADPKGKLAERARALTKE